MDVIDWNTVLEYLLNKENATKILATSVVGLLAAYVG